MSGDTIDDCLDDLFGPPPTFGNDSPPPPAALNVSGGLEVQGHNDILDFMDELEASFSSSGEESMLSSEECEDNCQTVFSECESRNRSNSCSSETSGDDESGNQSDDHNTTDCHCSSPLTICKETKPPTSKQPVGKLELSRSEFRESKAASDLKHYVYQTSLMELSTLQCNPTKCEHGGMCIQNTTIGDAISIRKAFWGTEDQSAFSHSERRAKARGLLTDAFAKNQNKFTFKIGSRLVCERGFLTILGLLVRPNARLAGSWVRTKASVQTGADDLKISSENEKLDRAAKRDRSKFINATAYIEWVAKFFGDTIPIAGQENVRVLPYEDVSKFYDEYVHHCKRHGEHPGLIAAKTTFHKAFVAKKDIRLLGCKGSFETCDICNHANDLLRDAGHSYTREQREIVLRFKRLHLEQQARERQHLEDNKLKCATDFDAEGNPMHALIFSDGMTAMRGDTPKFGRKTHAKGDKGKKIQNRVIGVEVVCGPVNEVFVYHTDNFVSSGANIMIEVQRQAMMDLGALLNTEHNMALPRHIMFQFDNCGENKNKEMFAYFSMLIESGALDQIDVNFMIVGHTHCSIDQYFSTLSSAIKDALFIGSPQSLWDLISTAHSSEYAHKRPKLQKQIRVGYDMKTALAPYLNKAIKHYQIPFNFKFTRVCNKAVMQYKLFSSFPTWLPRPPDLPQQTALDLVTLQVQEISLHRLASVGGQDALLATIDVSAKMTATKLLGNQTVSNNFNTLKLMVPDLFRLEERAIDNQLQRMHNEGEELSETQRGHTLQARYTAKQSGLANVQRALTQGDDKQRGYIMWLDSLSTRAAEQVPLELFAPAPFSPAILLQQLESQVPEESSDESGDDEMGVDAEAKDDGAKKVKFKVTTECKPMFSAACAIKEAALNVVKMASSKKHGEGRLKVSHLDAFQHEALCLSASEMAYYTEMSSELNVVKALHAAYECAPKWELLPATHMSETYKTTCAARRLQIERDMNDMVALAQKLLLKKGHNAEDDVEFIKRIGAQTAEVRKAKADAVKANKLANKAATAATKAAATKQAAAEKAAKKAATATTTASRKRATTTVNDSAANKRQTTSPASAGPAVIAPVNNSSSEGASVTMDSLCCCNECAERVIEICQLCGYTVCLMHRNCAEAHSHQLKRPGATIFPVAANPVSAAGPSSVTQAAGPVSVAQPETPPAAAQPALVDTAQPEVTAAATDPVSGAGLQVTPSPPVSATPSADLSKQPSAASSSSSSGGGASAVERLERFAGTWPAHSTAAAEHLYGLIVRAVVGEAKKTKGGSYQARLEAELHFPQYMKGNQLSIVAEYCGIDMSTSGAGDLSNKKEWYKFKDAFVREFLRKFGFV